MKYWMILASVSGIAVAIAIIYLRMFLPKHRKYRDGVFTDCESHKDSIPSAYSYIIKTVAEKRYDTIRTYHITQLSNKLSGIMSVTYSILGLLSFSSLFESEREAQIITSLLSIIFVVSALYVSPSSKAEQYWIAWQQYDSLVRTLMSEVLDKGGLKKKINQSSIEISTIEKSLSSDLI